MATHNSALKHVQHVRDRLEGWREYAQDQLRRAHPDNEAPWRNQVANYGALVEELDAAIVKLQE